jgi:hypothetical protein
MMKKLLTVACLLMLFFSTASFPHALGGNDSDETQTTNSETNSAQESSQDIESGNNTRRAPSFYQGSFSGSEGGITLERLTGSVIPRVVNWAASFIAAISVLFLVYGGLQYMSAGAEEEKVSAATRTVVYSIVGVLVAMFAYAIVFLFISLFSI